jgi:hypothetical protein
MQAVRRFDAEPIDERGIADFEFDTSVSEYIGPSRCDLAPCFAPKALARALPRRAAGSNQSFPRPTARYNREMEASMNTLSPEQRLAIESSGHVAIDDGAYVVVKAAVYERLRSLLQTGPLSIAEQTAMVSHIGTRAGWLDPRMDAYNDLDPRRKP